MRGFAGISVLYVAVLPTAVNCIDWNTVNYNGVDWSKVNYSGVNFGALDYHGHYFRQQWANPSLAVERLDPVMDPGKISSHVHSFVGANVVNPVISYEDTQKASCSQVSVKADNSVYWAPSLYFRSPINSSFLRVPETHKVLYYFNFATDPATNQLNPDLIEEFPPGFQMVAGDQTLRAPAATAQLKMMTNWYCHGPDVQAEGFPSFTSCPGGLEAQINFPYCWNGDDFNATDPTGHISYPVNVNGNGMINSGACPASHPKPLPTIKMEFWYDTDSFDGLYSATDTPWVISNGDGTGNSFHADFINGWQTGVLGNALKTCNIGESGDPLTDCFEVRSAEEQAACNTQTSDVQEDVEGWLPALPGCNSVSYGPDPVQPQNCNGNAKLNGVEQSSSSNTAQVPSSQAATGTPVAKTDVAVQAPSPTNVVVVTEYTTLTNWFTVTASY